jgi:uncharacterized protein involved in exopolysaccharide biosynthesis
MEKPVNYDLSWVPARAYSENILGGSLLSIWRRRGLVLIIVLLSLVASGAALSVLKKKYTAQATVQLDLGRREAALTTEQAPAVTLDASAIIQGEAKIIRSRMMARRVVQRLGLDADTPDDGPQLIGSMISEVTSFFTNTLGLADGDIPAADPAPVTDADTVITALLSRLTVVTDNRSYLIEIRYTSDNPARSAVIANAFAREYLRRRDELNVELANNVTSWLRQQIQDNQNQLRQTEGDITAFRQQMKLLETGANGETVQQQQLRDINTQLSAAALERLNEEGRLARVRQIIASGGIPSAADLQGAPIIQNLLDREAAARQTLSDAAARLGPRHPDVVRARAVLAEVQAALRAQLGKAVPLTAANLEATRRTEGDLKTRFEALHATLLDRKTQETELADLQARAQTLRQRANALTRDYDQALAAKNLQQVAGSLTVPAERVPIASWPKPIVVLGVGFAGGLVLGLFAAVMFERKDRGFRTAREVTELTGVPCLAMLPERRRRRRAKAGIDNLIFEEAVRAVGAGVGLFGNSGGCRVVLITSSLPHEGTSTVCQALARLLVGVGHRVLLIDGNRCSKPDEAAAAPEEAGNVMLLTPSGPGEPVRFVHQGINPMTDLFGPAKLDRLIADARKHFDIVLLDGAPVMLLADSFVLGRKADTVIHVIHWGKTRKITALNALQRLREQSVAVDATVLTRVVGRRHRKFQLKDEVFHYRQERRFFETLSLTQSRAAQAGQSDGNTSRAA